MTTSESITSTAPASIIIGDVTASEAQPAQPAPTGPRLGDIVLYTLSGRDVAQAVTQPGNLAAAGQTYPALVVRVWPNGLAQLRVFLDGPGAELWATSRPEGDGPGQWTPRV